MALSRSIIPAFLSRDWWDMWDFPSRIVDQHFGMDLPAEDYIPPCYYMRPMRQLSQRDTGHSTVQNEPECFKVMLDVSHFSPNEIRVKTVDKNVVINGKHEEKADQHGFVSREFTRRYMLPNGVEPESVTSSLSPDGILTIQGRKKALEQVQPKEREVPVTMQIPPAVEGSKPEEKASAAPVGSKPQEAKAPVEEKQPPQTAATSEEPKPQAPATTASEAQQATPAPEDPKPKEQQPAAPEGAVPAPATPVEAPKAE